MISRDRRISLRMPFVSKAICYAEKDENAFVGKLRNINTFGVFVEMVNCPAACTHCEITIVVQGDHSHLTINSLKGKVIRVEQDGIAVLFDLKFEWLPLVPLLYHKTVSQQKKEANQLPSHS